jgi:hypothetical protein
MEVTNVNIFDERHTHTHTHLNAKLPCQIRIIAIEFRTFLQMTELKFQTIRSKLEQNVSRLYHGRQKASGKKPVDSKRHGKSTSLETMCQKCRVTGR